MKNYIVITCDTLKKNIAAAEKVLIDNGIEEDEASTVLQAVGYALLDTELYPEGEEEKITDTERFDCIISAGERDPDRYGKYYDNEMRVIEVVKHNVTEKEAKAWLESIERIKSVQELEEIGRKKFGRDYWMKYSVNFYYTTARKD
jgi:hypothetical protein